MGKWMLSAWVILPVVAGLMLAGCAAGSLPVGTGKSASVVVASPVVTDAAGTVTPGVTGTDATVATAIPASTSNLSLLPTATPITTAKPTSAPMEACDYSVERKNGQAGVVDRNGKVVLDFKFAEINVNAIGAKVFFFAVPSWVDATSAKQP